MYASKKERLNSAFNEFATDEQKIILFLLEEDKKNRNVCSKIIKEELSIYRQKFERILDDLKKRSFVERIKYCPFCGQYHNLHIPPICDNCKKRIFPEEVFFKNKKYWPKYIIRIAKDKKQIIRDFICYFSHLENRLLIE